MVGEVISMHSWLDGPSELYLAGLGTQVPLWLVTSSIESCLGLGPSLCTIGIGGCCRDVFLKCFGLGASGSSRYSRMP